MTPPIENTPRRIINPRHSQPTRVGEFKNFRQPPTRNIYIQNNYLGGYRNWDENAWAHYDCDCNSGGNKFAEILGYVGLGMAGLSSIISLFKSDKS